MDIKINKTADGTRKYPHHCHRQYEIMHYISGEGYMWTENGKLPFSPDTAIIVPPHILHGSVSQACFVNISVECDFNGLLLPSNPTVIVGEDSDESAQLVRMIWKNRCGNETYLHALCIAYAQSLIQRIKSESEMTACIKHLVAQISERAFDPEADVTQMLRQSGFAEDYVRAHFKKETGKTPVAFLTDLRIRHACHLIDVYGSTLTLAQIAERCGYPDYVYFSKKFKEHTGTSPREYRKTT